MWPRSPAAARQIFRGPQFGVQDLAIDSQGAQSAIDVLTVALWVFAGVAALAGLVAITIVLSREISLGRDRSNDAERARPDRDDNASR